MCCKLLIVLLSYHLVLGDKSFTLVLDTTESMQEEIDVIKATIGQVVNSISNESPIGSFIIVPFKDPDVGPPIVKLTPEEFIDSLGSISPAGGKDCPENSLAGVEMALEISKPESFIYVFTDAYANDNSKFDSIANLCRNTQSQVIIFLSGSCVQPGSHGNLNVYYDVAKACSGSVLRFDSANLRQAFKFIKEMTKVEWTDVTTHDTFTDYKQLTVSVDSFTSDVVVAVSGQFPVLQIFDGQNKVPTIEKIIDTRNTLVIRIVNPAFGVYSINMRAQGLLSSTVYRKFKLPFQFGFCTRLPKSMKETTPKPIPGSTNYILIQVESSTVTLQALEIQILGANERTVLTLQAHNVGLYTTTVYIQPDKYFRISIKGHDTSNYQEISVTTKVLVPQKPVTNVRNIKPSIEIIEPDTNIVDFGTAVTIPCKVVGYPKPDMWWEDGFGNKLPSEDTLLEIPTVYINYVIIDNATVNSTLYCKCKNPEGETSKNMDLYVHRPFSFDVIQYPTDNTFEYGMEGKLYCEVNAYPTAEVKWYHNDTLIENDNLRIRINDNSLTIKNMSTEDVGTYTCEATNEVKTESFRVQVLISGIEAPEVEVEKSEIILKPGEWKTVECRILKGKPTPEIIWKHKSENDYDINDVPGGVYVTDGKLDIPSVKVEHKGVYMCEGVNIAGRSTSEVTIDVQYAPIIKNSDIKTMTVREGDSVELTCVVEAAPKATVRWEMSQDDVIIPFDNRHSTNHRHAHRFDALWKDSGNYHCIAENFLGKAEKTIKLNVLVPPYIEAPKANTMTVNVGADVELECNVLFGNPVPTTKWEFVSNDSTTTVLSRGNLKHTLRLNKVTRAREGTYVCLADNNVDRDSIRVYLKVL